MFILLTTTVNHLRLGPMAPAGMVAAVMPDLGRELVANGQAVQLTEGQFRERLRAGQYQEITACQTLSTRA